MQDVSKTVCTVFSGSREANGQCDSNFDMNHFVNSEQVNHSTNTESSKWKHFKLFNKFEHMIYYQNYANAIFSSYNKEWNQKYC